MHMHRFTPIAVRSDLLECFIQACMLSSHELLIRQLEAETRDVIAGLVGAF